MSELLKRYGPKEIMPGATPDLPSKVAPFVKDSRNILFAEGSLQPVAGQILLVPTETGEPCTGVQSGRLAGESVIFWGTPTKLFRWDETVGTEEIGTGFTGSDSDLWSLERWGNWMSATNGVDVPQIYKGTSFAALAGVTFATASIFVRRSPFLLAFETSGGSAGETGRMHWCDQDAIETWAPVTTNFAGSLPVRDIDSEIRAALTYLGNVAFLSSDSLHMTSFVGFPNVFGQGKLMDGIGAVGKKSVVEANRALYGFGPRGLWRSDGNSKQYFASPQIQKFIFDDLNVAQVSRVVAWHNRLEESIDFYYPSAASTFNDRGVSYNYENKNWGILSFGRTAVDDRGVFDFAISADRQGNLFFQNAGLSSVPQTGQDGTLTLGSEVADIGLGFGDGGFGQFPFGGEWTGDV